MKQVASTSIAERTYRRLLQALQPKRASLKLPDYFEDRTDLVLTTAWGRDNIALKLARHGWLGFEAPVPDVISFCAQRCEGAFIDAGANTGLYSLLAAKSSRTVQIHAFEPHARARTIFLANLKRNGLEPRVCVIEDALSDRAGIQNLYVPLQAHGFVESGSSLNAEFKPRHGSVVKVRVTTIDDYVHASAIDRLGLLKIDVESMEHQVLAGGARTIAQDRPLIVLEVLHLADQEALDRFCRNNHYRAFTLQPDLIKGQDRAVFHPAAWNQCFCPSESVELLEQCAQTIGLGFSA